MSDTLYNLVTLQDKVITLSDARELGGCTTGWKDFVVNQGYDWKEVVLHGLLASQLLATKDAMAINLVIYVYKRDGLLNEVF